MEEIMVASVDFENGCVHVDDLAHELIDRAEGFGMLYKPTYKITWVGTDCECMLVNNAITFAFGFYKALENDNLNDKLYSYLLDVTISMAKLKRINRLHSIQDLIKSINETINSMFSAQSEEQKEILLDKMIPTMRLINSKAGK